MDDEATVESDEGVGAAPPADTSAPAGGAAGPESAAVTPPGRSRLAVAMLVVSGLLLIGAVVFGVLGLSAQSEASDERDQAAAAVAHRHDLADQKKSVEAESDALLEQLVALPDRLQDTPTRLSRSSSAGALALFIPRIPRQHQPAFRYFLHGPPRPPLTSATSFKSRYRKSAAIRHSAFHLDMAPPRISDQR